jgi:hypothetical protein
MKYKIFFFNFINEELKVTLYKLFVDFIRFLMQIVLCRRKLFVNKGESNFEWQEPTKGVSAASTV